MFTPVIILLLTVMNASAEVYRFRFRGIDPNYAYQPYAILLLRESIACRAGVSYDKVILEGINGPDGYHSFTADKIKIRAELTEIPTIKGRSSTPSVLLRINCTIKCFIEAFNSRMNHNRRFNKVPDIERIQ